MNDLVLYDAAVKVIKTAILQGQYEAAKDVNRVQLVLYFSIGKYLSKNTRNGVWGEGALVTISEQLRKELPGLRGFSETQMRDMRRFYEAWEILDANSAVVTAELEKSNSTVMTAELLYADNEIDIFHTKQVSNVTEFPVEDFFKVPFTHHSIILSGTKATLERYYYIHRTAEEHLTARKLRQLIKEDAYKSQGYMPSNFARTINDPIEARRAVEMFKSIGIVLCQTANHSYAQYAVRDYTKPMGVATYKTLDDMPEKLRKALPDVNKMIEILKKKG